MLHVEAVSVLGVPSGGTPSRFAFDVGIRPYGSASQPTPRWEFNALDAFPPAGCKLPYSSSGAFVGLAPGFYEVGLVGFFSGHYGDEFDYNGGFRVHAWTSPGQ